MKRNDISVDCPKCHGKETIKITLELLEDEGVNMDAKKCRKCGYILNDKDIDNLFSSNNGNTKF